LGGGERCSRCAGSPCLLDPTYPALVALQALIPGRSALPVPTDPAPEVAGRSKSLSHEATERAFGEQTVNGDALRGEDAVLNPSSNVCHSNRSGPPTAWNRTIDRRRITTVVSMVGRFTVPQILPLYRSELGPKFIDRNPSFAARGSCLTRAIIAITAVDNCRCCRFSNLRISWDDTFLPPPIPKPAALFDVQVLYDHQEDPGIESPYCTSEVIAFAA